MSEIIVHLDQQDHKDINLGQEDAQELNLNNAHAVYGGLDFETKETESGIVKYNSETKKYSTLTPDSEVSEGSDNIVTSDAVKKYVDEFGGAIDTVSINGKVQPIDKNKNVNIEIPTKISDFENDGDGTSRFVTESFVEGEIKKIVGFAPEDLDTLEETANKIVENQQKVEDALKNTKQYTAGEGLNLTEEGEFSIKPATERYFGGLRVWEDDEGYLCFATEDWVAFKNKLENGTLKVLGVYNTTFNDGTLVLK